MVDVHCFPRMPSCRAGQQAMYTSEILEGPGGPQFRVTASNATGKEFVDGTPAGVWNKVHAEVSVIHHDSSCAWGLSLEIA